MRRKGLPSAAPPFWQTTQAALSLTVTRLRRGRTVWLAAGLCAFVVLSAVAVRLAGSVSADTLWTAILRYPLQRMLVFLVPFLFCATAVSEEVEARTILYLYARPAPKSAILLGKYLAGTMLGIAVIAATVLFIFMASYAGNAGEAGIPFAQLGTALGAFALAVASYGAVFLLFGVLLVDAPYVLCLLYVGIVELALSFVPSVVKLASMSFHLGNLLGLAGPQNVSMTWAPEVGAAVSASIIAIVGALALALATTLVSSTEVLYGKA